jgi:hypothetical protein
MATKNSSSTICSFCIKEFPDKSLYIVALPVNSDDPGSFSNRYGTPCCETCFQNEKGRYIDIIEHPVKKVRKSDKN